jgi:hypothetical protein
LGKKGPGRARLEIRVISHEPVHTAANAVAEADKFVAGLMPLVRAIQNTRANTLEAIIRALTERGVRSRKPLAFPR